MKVCIIPPLSAPELMREGDMVFVLCQQYIKDERYRNYVKQLKAEGMWIILDNGAGDFDTITMPELLEVAKDLMPNEIIPLDILFDTESTLKNLSEFIIMMEETGLLDKIDIFACPQGETKEDWLYCYKQMLSNPHVKTLGLSKIAVPHAWKTDGDDQGIMEGRHMCYEELTQLNLIEKPIHCLGAGDPREFLKYKENPLMRSTDSCFSVWSAMNEINWTAGQFTRIPTPRDYFERGITEEQKQLAVSNVEFLKKIAH